MKRSLFGAALCIALTIPSIPPVNAHAVSLFTTPYANILCVYHEKHSNLESFVYCIADELKRVSYPSDTKCINSEGNFNGERPYGYQFLLQGNGEVSIVCTPPRYAASRISLEYLYEERRERIGLVTIVGYGRSIRIGNIVCNTGTLRTPLTCKTQQGSGFSISKTSQKVFRT